MLRLAMLRYKKVRRASTRVLQGGRLERHGEAWQCLTLHAGISADWERLA
jgi:hypothetical protein